MQVPNGDGPRNHPALKGLNLPPLGTAGRPAPLVTKTLLFVGEGSDAIPGCQGMRSGTSSALTTRPPARWSGRPTCLPVRPARRDVSPQGAAVHRRTGRRKESPPELVALGLPGGAESISRLRKPLTARGAILRARSPTRGRRAGFTRIHRGKAKHQPFARQRRAAATLNGITLPHPSKVAAEMAVGDGVAHT